jgi:hypothetical protein
MEAPATLALDPSHFENIDEIGFKPQFKRKSQGLVAEIAHQQPLERGRVPKEFRAPDVNQVVLEDQAIAVPEIGIGEIAGERGVIVA